MRPHRRRFLRLCGIAGTGAIAGCLTGLENDDQSADDQSASGQAATDSPTPVQSPTATLTRESTESPMETDSGRTQQTKLAADDGDNQDFFGRAVEVSGDGTTAIVGAAGDDNVNGLNAGAAYVFEAETQSWVQQAKLTPRDGESGDQFGNAVAVSGDGNTVIIGAVGDGGPNGENAGSAYIFEGSGQSWEQRIKLTPSDGGSEAFFGQSVALSNDGSTALVGASGADAASESAGSAYVFRLTEGSWSQQAKLSAEDGIGGDRFGNACALADEGTTAVVGADRDRNPNGQTAGSAYVFELTEESWSPQTKLTAADGDGDDRFGNAVTLSGDGTTVIIGAVGDEDPNGENAGSAYIFEESNQSWDQRAKVTPDDGDDGDSFARSVAMSDDGTTALLGATPEEDPNGESAGTAYIFGVTDDSWSQQAKLTADDGDSGDHFGSSVTVSSDGTAALLGADWDEQPNGYRAGSAYIFEATDGSWTQRAKLFADDGNSGDRFGHSVTVSGDGTTILVGTGGDQGPNGLDAGPAYVFEATETAWTRRAVLSPTGGGNRATFGWSVAVSNDGTTAVIAAPRDSGQDRGIRGDAYVFEATGESWTRQARLTPEDELTVEEERFPDEELTAEDRTAYVVTTDGLSASMTLTEEQNVTALLRADSAVENATVTQNDTDYVVYRSNETRRPLNEWLPEPSTREYTTGNSFTYIEENRTRQTTVGTVTNESATIEGTGPDDRTVELTDGTTVTLIDGDSGGRFGESTAVSADGTTVIVGAPWDSNSNGYRAGAAYIFEETEESWTQQAKLTAGDGNRNDEFGDSVAVSSDGTTAVVGAHNDEDPNGRLAGSAYVFDVTDGSWTQQAKLAATDGDSLDSFGDSVAVSSDGTTALVGAAGDEDPNGGFAGSAYVFEASDGAWTQQAKLIPDDGDDSDHFGTSVAMSGDGTAALIGADWDENPNKDEAGSAYLFEVIEGSWTQQAKLAADDGDRNDEFGAAVAMSGDGATGLITAPGDEDPNGEDGGSAYVFNLQPTSVGMGERDP